MVGALRLTPYRIVLLMAFMPALSRLLSGRAGKTTIVDTLVLLHLIWTFSAIGYHHGFDFALESGGIRIVELGGAYLVARAYIIDQKTFMGAVALLLTIICILAPVTLFESISGIHLIRKFTAAIFGHSFTGIGDRLGLTRAFGPFDHPIHYGVVAASLLGIAVFRPFPQLGLPKIPRFPKYAVITGAVSSVSSGALASLMTQFLLLLWEKKSRLTPSRWKKLTGLILFLYIVVDMISNRGAMKVFLSYLTFSPGTAYNRIIIFDYGIQDVWRNPIWGIGFNVWTRPTWMHSTSMDNFWLVQAVSFGLPGFFTIALPVLIALSKNWHNMSERARKLRTGWTISMIGMILSACTVHFWNSLFVYFAFFLGLGGWFLQQKLKAH